MSKQKTIYSSDVTSYTIIIPLCAVCIEFKSMHNLKFFIKLTRNLMFIFLIQSLKLTKMPRLYIVPRQGLSGYQLHYITT